MSRVGGSPVEAGGAAAGVTPLVLTYNEAPNIGRCLERLAWARRVIVLDSGSTDETAGIVSRFPNAELHVRSFDNHAAQWNHGLALVSSPWVLSLDADYLVPQTFVDRVAGILGRTDVDAVFASFRYCIMGRPLRGSLYPPRAVLFRREKCRYETDGHTQRLAFAGPSTSLGISFDHDDRKTLNRWLEAQGKYSKLEAEKLLTANPETLTRRDRLRRSVVLGPPVVFLYTLLVARTIFDGWPGWYYTLQRTLAEVLLSLHLLDRRLRGPKPL